MNCKYSILLLILEISSYKVYVSKNNISDSSLKDDILNYWLEANYPDNEDTRIICKDLKRTLQLDVCYIRKKS